MRTVEFIKEVENLGFKAKKTEKLIEIYDQQNTLLIKVREDIEFGIDTMHSKLKEYDPIIKKNLINLVFEYAATPIKSRGPYLEEIKTKAKKEFYKYMSGHVGTVKDVLMKTKENELNLKVIITPRDYELIGIINDDDYEEWEQEALEDESDNEIVMLPQSRLTQLPVLRVKDSHENNIKLEHKVVGANVHDKYVLGKDGGLHYFSTQSYIGTEYGEILFDVEEDEEYGGVFESWNFFELMEHDAKILKINDHFSYKDLKKALRNLFTLTLKERDRKNKEVITNYSREYRC
jgi:hypothetical protein